MDKIIQRIIFAILRLLFVFIDLSRETDEEDIDEIFDPLGFLIRGASIIIDGPIYSRTDIRIFLNNSYDRTWIDIRSMKKPPAKFYLKKGFIVTGKENLDLIKDLLLVSPKRIFIVGRGFNFNILNNFLDRKANIILDSSSQEFDILSLIQKGKNRIFVKGKNFDLEQLLAFAKNDARVILDNSLTIQDINSFLFLPNKNIYIKAEGFEVLELENFLKRGGNIILRTEGVMEAEVRNLIDKGKRKVWIDTCDFFEN